MVFDIDSAVQKYRPVLDTGIKDMEDEAKSLKEKRETCETAVEKMKTGNTDICKEIKEVFEKLRKALDDREQELIDMAISHSGKGSENIEEKIKLIKEKEALVNETIVSLQQAKAAGKVKEMFSIHQKVKDYKKEAPVTISEIYMSDQSSCTFSGKDDSTLVSRISNFGDISVSSTRSERSGYSSSLTNGYGSSRYGGSSDTTSRYAYSSRYIPRTYRY